ncbi:hypothetical protein HBH98_117360 [Parastagonospora nodorum]|nr:hypothetical protein HBH52_211300 [Parastagonospora nodorum]KAH4043922.1 hypothetical protein HBH49_223030 [Parastagonospora nodorum]KAH4094375.1 hypothetical protein HBH46_172900 [Parastagonospora nodorum]KAH4345904.1 hypothetical protein HBH98_117360 [Parastagonospora nodorum]KAH4378317.1 hypothetical protein HBH97_101560 [Parastagonospora nodorum]
MLLVPTITNELDTAPKTFHPWQYLPIELKIMILDVPLRLTRAVRFLTHPSHVNRAFQSLTLTSKEMRSLALQVYYGNAVMLEPVFRSRKLDPRYELRFVLAYTKPVIGALVRRLQLQLQVDDGFNFLPGCDALRPKTNQWWLLLRLNAGPPGGSFRTDWQLSFPNLNSFNLKFDIRRGHWDGDREPEDSAQCLGVHKTNSITVPGRRGEDKNVLFSLLRLEDMLKGTVVMLNTRHFSVEVSGFACAGFARTQKAVGVQCPNECSEKVAATIKDVFTVRRAIEK